jgi:hypothetical protein
LEPGVNPGMAGPLLQVMIERRKPDL